MKTGPNRGAWPAEAIIARTVFIDVAFRGKHGESMQLVCQKM
jgi:hypothetical protein